MLKDRLILEQVSKYFYRHSQNQLTFPNNLNPFLKNKKEIIKAVDNIPLEVELGKIYGILGVNGSGKSTLIRLISTLLLPLLPDSGRITVFGYDVVITKHVR